jgi:hypothetical protein
MGKEGVDGSSPSEGSAKAPEIGAFSLTHQRRHERRLATHLHRLHQPDLQENCAADDLACTDVTLPD